MKVIIDRFEGEFAVCEKEDRKMINILKDKIPEGAKEGTVLNLHDNGKIGIDVEGTERKIKEIEKLMKDLFN
ncbi:MULTISPECIES: DUF3006 domain-containing protein [Clostridium]|uniref:DUF3006 domain-containing protein n=1 Tax=Clostridium TaxID=1485 RepID=UPI000824E62B|nr:MULTISPECIES: DUF3006 domain-containing protein [Clostridium]PJI08065.1 DUF3006 domain-containing protein [Clostridium sp. CT7]